MCGDECDCDECTQDTIGSQGFIGMQGQSSFGHQGPIGFQGSETIGQQGPFGFQGGVFNGPQGVDGSQGPLSHIPPDGYLGQTGLQGQTESGVDGPNGPQGRVGYDGPNGPQGFIGFTQQPARGSQGTFGVQGNAHVGPQGIMRNFQFITQTLPAVNQTIFEVTLVTAPFFLAGYIRYQTVITTTADVFIQIVGPIDYQARVITFPIINQSITLCETNVPPGNYQLRALPLGGPATIAMQQSIVSYLT